MANSLPVDVWLEWAPSNAVTTSDALCSWTRMSSAFGRADHGILDAKWDRGVDQVNQRFQAGTMSVTFLDPNGRYSPLNPSSPNAGLLGSRRRIRLRAQTGVLTDTLWSGITTKFTPDWCLGLAWTTVDCVDILALDNVPVWDSAFFGEIITANPVFWFPMSEGGGGISYDYGNENGFNSLGVGKPGGGYTLSHVNTAPQAANSPAGWGSEQPTQFGSNAYTFLEVNGGLTNSSAGKPFTVMFVACLAPNPAANTVQTAWGQGTTPAAGASTPIMGGASTIAFTTGTGGSVWMAFQVYQDGNNGNYFVTSSTAAASGAPFLVIARYDPANSKMNILINNSLCQPGGITGILRTTSAGVAVIGAATPVNYQGAAGDILVGNGVEGTSSLLGSLEHWAMWFSYVSDAECTALYNAWNSPGNGETADVRIKRFLSAAGIGTSNFTGDVGIESLGPASYRPISGAGAQPLNRAAGVSSGGQVVELCRRAANTETGRFFVDRQGRYAFHNRLHPGNSGATYDTNHGASPVTGVHRIGYPLTETQSTFETGVDATFWQLSGAATALSNTGSGYTGSHSALFTTNGATFYAYNQTVGCQPGQYVQMAAATWLNSATATVYAFINFLDAAGGIVQTSLSPGVVCNSAFKWLTVGGIAPPLTTHVQVSPCYTNTGAAGLTQAFDCVTLDIFMLPAPGTIPLVDAVYVVDDHTFYNEATVQIAAPQPVALTVDAASTSTLGIVPWTEPTEYSSNTTAIAGANRVIGTGLPKTQLQQAKVLYHDDLPDEVLFNDVGDRVVAVSRPANAAPFVQPSVILKVAGHLDGRALTLEVDWYLTPS